MPIGNAFIIADDITGAAEIAGIAISKGVAVRIVRGHASCDDLSDEELLIIDTDSRSIDADLAAQRVRNIVTQWVATGRRLIFKKTDSALRGNVAMELRACLEATHLKRAVLIPANPSRGRTIHDGMYYIDGISIDKTEFVHDPEHPSCLPEVLKLLGPLGRDFVHVKSPERDDKSIYLTGDVRTVADVDTWSRVIGENDLPAGGADFFLALMSRWFVWNMIQPTIPHQRIPPPQIIRPSLVVCGSCSDASIRSISAFVELGAIVVSAPPNMTMNAMEESLLRWRDQICEALLHASVVIIETRSVIGRARDVRQGVARVVSDVSKRCQIGSLLIEGGATASEILMAQNWNCLHCEAEIARGVIRLSVGHGQPILYLKPGSYSWTDSLMQTLIST